MSFSNKVNAAGKTLATCTYTPKTLDQSIKGISLTATVYDDGSVGNVKLKLGSWSKKPKPGSYVSDTRFIQQFDSKMFDKNGSFYKAFKKVNTCPKIQFIIIDGDKFHFNSEGNRITEGQPNDLTEAVITNQSSNLSKDELICEGSVNIDAINDRVKIRFKQTGSRKYFEIDEGDKGVYTANYNEIAVDGASVNYRINAEDQGKYWNKDTCKKTPVYARKLNGDVSQIVIQSTKPDEAEDAEGKANGSVGAGGLIPSNPSKTREDLCSLLEGDAIEFAKKIVGYLQLGTILLVLILGIMDFAGAIGSDKDGAFKTAGVKFLKRLVAAALVLLVPAILGIILSFIGVANDCNVSIFG